MSGKSDKLGKLLPTIFILTDYEDGLLRMSGIQLRLPG